MTWYFTPSHFALHLLSTKLVKSESPRQSHQDKSPSFIDIICHTHFDTSKINSNQLVQQSEVRKDLEFTPSNFHDTLTSDQVVQVTLPFPSSKSQPNQIHFRKFYACISDRVPRCCQYSEGVLQEQLIQIQQICNSYSSRRRRYA